MKASPELPKGTLLPPIEWEEKSLPFLIPYEEFKQFPKKGSEHENNLGEDSLCALQTKITLQQIGVNMFSPLFMCKIDNLQQRLARLDPNLPNDNSLTNDDF